MIYEKLGENMAIFTQSELNEQIAAWKQALLVLSSAQEYTMGTRRLRRSDLPEVRKTLQFLESEKSSTEQKPRRAGAVAASGTW